jgi:2',3'-cyclic-nucleotide 2'-phosphodiesterase (5'-nucleotidase family)
MICVLLCCSCLLGAATIEKIEIRLTTTMVRLLPIQSTPLLARMFVTLGLLVTLVTSLAVTEPLLPFGDINVVVVTDTHSWIGGHKKNEAQLDASYGDLLSFYEQLKVYCDQNEKDLWFVMNGDWIDGTGLAMDGDPSHLIPLLEKMPFDVVNVGFT